MASIVDRPGVKPDCRGRRRAVSSGWSLASSFGKHFSGNGKQGDHGGIAIPQLLRGTLPLYSETMIPSRHLECNLGIRRVQQ